MSKRSSKAPKLGKTPSQRQSVVEANQAKPSTSNTDPKELYSYTPNWITPEEKAKLKARVKQIKMREQRLTLKEDVLLLHASKKDSKESGLEEPQPEPDKAKGKAMKKKSSTSSVASTNSKDEEKLQRTKSEKSVKSDKSRTSDKSSKASKESMKKEKSKDSVKSNKSEKGKPKDEKGKKKEDLRMSKKNEEAHGKHPKEAHANPSGNTMEKKPEREVSQNELNDHLYATEYAQFDPQLYHFKSPEKLSTKNPVLAECPPFWVLLDHTIAVTWKLFCPDAERKDLGIIPLQWSREFVSAMRDERGEYLPATGQLLSAIEDALIDRYAKAADADESEKSEKDDNDRSSKKGKKEQDSLSYVSSENIFKYPVEVSYTLKDIMSRNMPGRKLSENEEGGVQCKVDPAVKKVDVPPPEDHESMNKSDMLGYLKQLKEEQDLRVQKEKEHSEKIDALMELLVKGKIDGDLWFEGHDSKKKHDKEHVHFDQYEDDDDEALEPGKKEGKSKSEKDKGKADGKGKGKEKGKEKGKGAPGKEEDKKEKAGKDKASKDKTAKDEEQKKKKVLLEEDKDAKKGKEGKNKKKKSDASLSSKSSNASADTVKSTKSEGSNKPDDAVG